MNKFINIFAFLFAAFFVLSCEPSRAENGDFLFGVDNPGETGGGGGTGGNNGSNRLLKKMTVVDADGGKGIFVYNYTAGALTSANLDDEGDKSDFTFNYKDNKLSQFVMSESDGSSTIKTTVNLVYDNGGRLVSSSGNMEAEGEELNKNKTTYTYNTSGKIIKMVTSLTVKDIDNPSVDKEVFNYTSDVVFAGENITSWIMTLKTITPPPITIDPIVLDVKLSNYDGKKNPLATLPYELNLAGAHFLTSTNSILGLSANNYGTAVIKSNAETQTANFTFVYNSDGYPVSANSAQGSYTYEYQ